MLFHTILKKHFFIFICLSFYSLILKANDQQDTSDFPTPTHKDSLLLEEVFISLAFDKATRKSIPLPVTIVSEYKLDNAMAINAMDAVVKNTPGVAVLKTGPNISKPFIRGLGYNRVLTLFDGVRQEGQQWGEEHGLEIDDYNISKVEVIKGPASLIYGSDALAGVISFSAPEFVNTQGKIHGKFTSELQTNNSLIGNGLRLHWGKNRFAFNASGSYRVAKNYQNKADGRVYGTNFSNYNILLGGQYRSKNGISNITFTAYDNWQAIPDGSRDSATRAFTKQIHEGDADTIRPIVSERELNSYKTIDLHQRIQYYRIIIDNEYGLGLGGKSGKIKLLLGGTKSIRREFNHPTQLSRPGLHVVLNTFTYNFRYLSPKVGKTDFIVGINGMLQGNKSDRDATDFPIPDYNLASIGGYVLTRIKLNKWNLTGGLRYDIRNMSFKDFYTDESNPDFAVRIHSLPTENTDNIKLLYKHLNQTFHGLSFSVGATFEASQHVNFKLNVARGFRAPNISELAANDLDPGAHLTFIGKRDAKPEFSYQSDFEMDFSWPDISATAGIFFNHLQNYIYFKYDTNEDGSLLLDNQQNKTLRYEQGAGQVYGVEATLNFHPRFIKGFHINNSFYYLQGDNLAFKGKGNEGGAHMQLIPPAHYLGTISQNFSIHKKALQHIMLLAEIEHSGLQNRYFGLDETETRTFAYTLFNAGAQLKFKYGNNVNNHIRLSVQINNIFNTIYQNHLNRFKYFENDTSRYNNPNRNVFRGMYNMGRNIVFKLVAYF